LETGLLTRETIDTPIWPNVNPCECTGVSGIIAAKLMERLGIAEH
jgi:hypothetical protein